VVNAAGMLICSSIIMLPLVLTSGALGLSRPNTAAVAALGGLATVSTALAYLLYFRILATAGATNVLLVTFLIPVGALLLGVGVLGEVIHALEFAGMGFIFTGLMVIDGRVLTRIKKGFDGRQKKQSYRDMYPDAVRIKEGSPSPAAEFLLRSKKPPRMKV